MVVDYVVLIYHFGAPRSGSAPAGGKEQRKAMIKRNSAKGKSGGGGGGLIGVYVCRGERARANKGG